MLWPTYRRAGIGRYEYNAMMREAGILRKIHGVRLKQGPVAFSFATTVCGTGTAGRTKGEDERNMHAGSAREKAHAQAACKQALQTATEEKGVRKKLKRTPCCCAVPVPGAHAEDCR